MNENTQDTFAKVLALPVRLVTGLFKHPKMLIILVIVVIAFVSFNRCSGPGDTSQQVTIPEYQKIAPNVKDAPYVVRTSSRVYYVKAYDDSEGVLTLYEYYTYDNKKWQMQDFDLPIDRKYYGEILVYERQK